ncbi:MAG: serine/threonine-protein kinase [Chloroflexota bacterium]
MAIVIGIANKSLPPDAVLEGRYKITGISSIRNEVVYQARDMHFHHIARYVAIKEVRKITFNPDNDSWMFYNFGYVSDLFASLSHPAIPKIFGHFSTIDGRYVVMDCINGRDLGTLIQSTSSFLPTALLMKWAVQLCDVLHYLHTHLPEPIIFRNAKPSTIMINQYGDVRLIDLVNVRVFWGQLYWIMSNAGAYSPPEPDNMRPCPASDLYSLGATLHYALTRQDPNDELPLSFDKRPIRAINPSVSPALEAIILRAVAVEPKDRYSSAFQMKQALEVLLVAKSKSA